MSLQRNVNSPSAGDKPTTLLSASLCCCILIVASAIASSDMLFWGGFPHENEYFYTGQNKWKNNSEENVLRLMVLAGTKSKGEAGTSIAHCLVELFEVATSKIMRCHCAAAGMREGQARVLSVKRNHTFPAFLCFVFFCSLKNVLYCQ